MDGTGTLRLITEAAGRPLRQRFLRPGLPATIYPPVAAIHVGAFVGEHLAACVSLLDEDEAGGRTPGVWRLRGMVTDPAHRGQGLGGAVLEFAVSKVREQGARMIWCDGRTTALAFYRRHGFEPVGAEFISPGTGPHFRMIRRWG